MKLGRGKIVSIEAKLESGESNYPSSESEKKVWNDIFGNRESRVKRLELQQYMFSEVMGMRDVDYFVIDKNGSSPSSIKWIDIFKTFSIKNSFTSTFISSNIYLQ